MTSTISRDSIAYLGPYLGAASITLDATIDATRGIVSTDGGDVAMTFADGTELTMTLAADVVYPFSITEVATSGTTATEIYALY